MSDPPTIPPSLIVEHLIHGLREYAIFALEPGGSIASWSAGGLALTGYSADEIAGRPLSVLLGENGPATAATVLERAAEPGGSDLAQWVVRRDGTRFWAVGNVSAIRREPELAGYVVVLRDGTERQRIQEALRVSEATYHGILAIGSDAVVSVSDEQRITFFNHGAEVMFGYASAEVLGQPLEILVPEYVRANHHQHVRDFAASGVSARRMGERGEISGVRKDGTIFPAEAAISKLEIEGTRVFTAVLRDVTERRDKEEELAARARELARSNEELEQFAYVASHDLQEPLRMVASYTQLLARRYGGKLDKDADEFIGYAVDGAARMRELIDDLLAYSRVGMRGGEWSDVSLDEVLERVRQTVGPAVETAGGVLTSEPLPTVRGDPIQFLQLFQNLVMNALKFHGKEPPQVHVSATRGEREWTVSVRDNGIGIAPEFRDRIFVIFQRLHSRAEYPGTGIGLAICRKIVQGHEGRIWVESEPGQGSIFHFTLPDESESL